MNTKDSQDLIAAFKEIIFTRRSWRKFTEQKIDKPTIASLLETTSRCPSSFGLEPWKVLVISNPEIKAKLEPFCDNQKQITTCSHLFVILSYKSHMFLENSPWMIKRSMTKRNLTTENEYHNFYQNRFMHFMKQINDWDQWSIRQAYILLETILLSATAHGLGASPMEGIDIKKIVEFLEKEELIKSEDKNNFNCPFVIAMGYMDDHYHPNTKKVSKISDTFIIID